MATRVLSRFMDTFEGANCTTAVDGTLNKGDVLEAFVVKGEHLSPAALLVVQEVFENYLAVNLVASADKSFSKDLVSLGDPVFVFFGNSPEECGFLEGGVGLGVARVVGNVGYPVDLRFSWLRGALAKKAKGAIDKLAASLFSSAVASPPRFCGSCSRLSVSMVPNVGGFLLLPCIHRSNATP